jgi:hypothetical protein
MNGTRVLLAVGIGLTLLASARLGSADVWDINSTDDDGSTSNNEISHGIVQVHDLGAQAGVADQDWIRVQSAAYSSYEATLEGMTGRLGNGSLGTPAFDRLNYNGNFVLGTATAFPNAPFAYAQTMRWQNTTAVHEQNHLRVRFASCNTTCDSNDQYTLRFFETTLAVPRFNNAGGQVTVLLVQNPTSYPISGNVFLWDAAGGLIGGPTPFALPAHGLFTFNTSSVAPAVGGSITVTHDGRHGDLTGKSVALEPATGFTFDSILVPRVH